jgi:hypothetical protein
MAFNRNRKPVADPLTTPYFEGAPVAELEPVDEPAGRAVPSEEDNAYERAAAGEQVAVTLPESEQPHPVYGFGPIPGDTDTQE